MTRPRACLDCARPLVPNNHRGAPPPGHARHVARGLCANHYVQRTYRRTLLDLPRLTHTRTDVIEDVTWLITTGTTTRGAIATRLDMTWPAIARALYRADRADLIARTTR